MDTVFQAGFIYLLAGLVQGLTGFGAALVAIPLLCLVMDVKTAVPLTILNGLIIVSYLAYVLRRHMDGRKIMPLLLGALPGVLLGALVLKQINPHFLKMMLGAVLLCYSLYNVFKKERRVGVSPIWAYPAGFLTGFLTATLSAGGPPTIIYMTRTDWNKEEIKATLTGFFLITASFTVLVESIGGLISASLCLDLLVTAPFVLCGTMVGSRLTGKINREVYLRIVFIFLAVMGVVMLFG